MKILDSFEAQNNKYTYRLVEHEDMWLIIRNKMIIHMCDTLVVAQRKFRIMRNIMKGGEYNEQKTGGASY